MKNVCTIWWRGNAWKHRLKIGGRGTALCKRRVAWRPFCIPWRLRGVHILWEKWWYDGCMSPDKKSSLFHNWCVGLQGLVHLNARRSFKIPHYDMCHRFLEGIMNWDVPRDFEKVWGLCGRDVALGVGPWSSCSYEGWHCGGSSSVGVKRSRVQNMDEMLHVWPMMYIGNMCISYLRGLVKDSKIYDILNYAYLFKSHVTIISWEWRDVNLLPMETLHTRFTYHGVITFI